MRTYISAHIRKSVYIVVSIDMHYSYLNVPPSLFFSLYLTCLQAALSSEKEIKHVLRELIQASKPISTTDVVRESET